MTLRIFSLTVLLLLSGFTAFAQEPTDPILQLNLAPEQRQKIRLLTQETRDERQSTNRRLREANVALDVALEADPINENLVEQRLNELAAAQAAQTRMRVHMELRVRRLLYPEQLATLKRLRLQVRDVMNPQRQNNPRRPNADAFRPNVRRP
ncbi:MAG TPA: Spy/CpxP family protein refolding chaperone [Pyrinomonadaceae bacterium]|nr:Spy/CpxP family protein refolding chaperone [Pyrinomonadaceae bacterium]